MTSSQAGDVRRWFLFEYSDELLQKIYQLGENPEPQLLFEGTELGPYADQSPILVGADANPSISAAVNDVPEDWPGLVIESNRPQDMLLKHLRHILFIGFDGVRKGVLRYSNPRTASYFFPACTQQDLFLWLGPIHALAWCGATWRTSATEQARWQRVENPAAAQWEAALEPALLYLNDEQSLALRCQQTERFLYQWWATQSILSFPQAWDFLQEGMASGFVSAESLITYLGLRSAYPRARPPAGLPQGPDEHRLEYLKTSMERSSTDKECQA